MDDVSRDPSRSLLAEECYRWCCPLTSMFALDYLHAVIKEVSEAEERNMSSDDLGAQAAGSSEDLEGEGVGITFTARKASSKYFFLIPFYITL